ncbi:MAG: type II toxin-antitoxin system HicB family antitoxin [Actinomycetota bacterium]
MTKPVRTYHAEVRRSGKYWAIHVPEVDRWTQARHLRELNAMTEDLIELMTGATAGTFTVEYDIELPAAVRRHLAKAEQLRARSAQAQAAAAAEVRAAARELHQGGLPLRDVGQLLGISHQRAHQLVAG